MIAESVGTARRILGDVGAKLTFSLTMPLSLNSGDAVRKPTGRQGHEGDRDSDLRQR